MLRNLATPPTKNPSSPKDLFPREFYPGEYLHRTSTLNISVRKIELAMRQQDIEEFSIGILANFPIEKLPLKNSLSGNFPPHGKLSPIKISPAETCPPPEKFMHTSQ